MIFSEVALFLERFENATKRYYLDLSIFDEKHRIDSLLESVGKPIWIERGDFEAALDHLAANLMMLRVEAVWHNREALEEIARNIAKSLGPLSASPWIGPFHEELFDWLEKNVWVDLFERNYRYHRVSARGWKKTISMWLV